MANANIKSRDANVKGAIDYSIKVNGKLPPSPIRLVGLFLEYELNRIPAATLIIDDGSVAKADFEMSSLDLFLPGNELEIQFGYLADTPLIFKGVIVKHRIEVINHVSQLELVCKDQAFKMCLRRESRYFENITDSEMAEELIGNHQFSHQIASLNYRHPELVQYNVSDWDFLIMRMEMNGLLTILENNHFQIQPPDLDQEPVRKLQYGDNVIAFEGELEVRNQFKEIKTISWDYSKQELLNGEAIQTIVKPNRDQEQIIGENQNQVNGAQPNILRHGGQIVEDELQAWANACLVKERLSWAAGRVSIEGDPTLKPGQLLRLSGFGQRFEGNVFISGIGHEYHDGVWTTNVAFGLSPKWFAETVKVEAPLAAGMLAAVNGLQIGLVTQIENDPTGDYRIQVRLPIIDSQSPGIWARLATLDAGTNRGTFFLPEIDDEVIIGFINDDPRDAIILGMLHSRNKTAPFEATSENLEKGFVSREGMKIVFHEGEKSITLETPGGNQLHISDEQEGFIFSDQHGNTIQMNADGISLNSEKDITINAKQNVKTSAGSSWQTQSKGKVSLKAASLNEIKGMPVNIN